MTYFDITELEQSSGIYYNCYQTASVIFPPPGGAHSTDSRFAGHCYQGKKLSHFVKKVVPYSNDVFVKMWHQWKRLVIPINQTW